MEDNHIPIKETDCDKVCASLREKLRTANTENASLREQIDVLNKKYDKNFDPEKCDCLQMQYVSRMANAYEAEIESIRGENTELRQALKEAVYFMDNHKDQMAYNPVDKCRKLIGE